MECAEIHGVHNGSRRSNKKALPINDFSFVSLHYEVSFHLSEAFYEEDKSRSRITGKCLEKPGESRKSKV